jgi:hypothetical protein
MSYLIKIDSNNKVKKVIVGDSEHLTKIVDDEAEVVKQVFSWFVNGKTCSTTSATATQIYIHIQFQTL